MDRLPQGLMGGPSTEEEEGRREGSSWRRIRHLVMETHPGCILLKPTQHLERQPRTRSGRSGHEEGAAAFLSFALCLQKKANDSTRRNQKRDRLLGAPRSPHLPEPDLPQPSLPELVFTKVCALRAWFLEIFYVSRLCTRHVPASQSYSIPQLRLPRSRLLR